MKVTPTQCPGCPAPPCNICSNPKTLPSNSHQGCHHGTQPSYLFEDAPKIDFLSWPVSKEVKWSDDTQVLLVTVLVLAIRQWTEIKEFSLQVILCFQAWPIWSLFLNCSLQQRWRMRRRARSTYRRRRWRFSTMSEDGIPSKSRAREEVGGWNFPNPTLFWFTLHHLSIHLWFPTTCHNGFSSQFINKTPSVVILKPLLPILDKVLISQSCFEDSRPECCNGVSRHISWCQSWDWYWYWYCT